MDIAKIEAIEKATAQVEKIYNNLTRTNILHGDKNSFCRTFNVTDPENWYMSSIIIGETWKLVPKDGNSIVRMLFYSYDDFAMYRDFYVFPGEDIEATYKFCQCYLREMPITISYTWLDVHGFMKL